MDRISTLPNELLCHILSFLTTKEVALTSVLSKRWLNLIAFVPNLHIDDSVFLHPEEDKRDRPEIIQSFMDFVDRILTLQGDSPIKKLSLKCLSLTHLHSTRVDTWISNVLARGVSDLDLLIILDMDDEDNYRLCPKSFESSTLVNLKIDCGIEIGWSSAESIFLPVLRTLVIDSAQVRNFEILLPALPVLEELVLVDVIWFNWDVKISSGSLKTLKMKESDNLHSLSIDTPNLVCFTFNGGIARDYPLVNMKKLVDARINFSLTEEQVQLARTPVVNDDHPFINGIIIGFTNVWKLFHGIQDVPYLYLSPDTLEVLSLCSESMPVYKNLKSLAIKSDKARGWQAMPVLLRNCPHLETLVLEGLLHYTTDKCGDACDCISREFKGHSLATSPVKMLEIQGFRGTFKEIILIMHFLDYFPSLKEMEIYIEDKDPTVFRIPEEADPISKVIIEINKLSSCNVQLLVSDYLYEKWTMQRKEISEEQSFDHSCC